jgi:uncharacterized protein RhaS with RHS repeats
LQRFISEDPIRFNGGTNFYAYVLNNPMRLVDPDGLIHGIPGSACPTSKRCRGKARVLGGNPNTVGAQGAFPGTSVQAGSAAVIPQQFGGSKGGLTPYIGQISGRTAGGQSFNGVSDVIGGKSPTPGTNVRDALQALYPGLPIIELPTGRDEGIVDIEITVPNGLPCPVGTVEQNIP